MDQDDLVHPIRGPQVSGSRETTYESKVVSPRARNVGEFVDVKAPDFNTFQQGTAAAPQTVQFKASKNHTFL